MRKRWPFGLVAILGLITAAAVAAPKRKKVDCAAFRADVQKSSKAVGMEMTIKAGDWATIPAPLRALPPGATVCGSATMGIVFIASPLFGKELQAYYQPIYEKLGCKPFTCEVDDKKTSCDCRGGGTSGSVRTEELNEVYALTFR